MKLEIIDQDVKEVRLTVTPDRITIKYPIGYDGDRLKIEKLVNEIKNSFQVTNSWRGRFDDYGITLWVNGNKASKRFNF